jgi:hypothetical protein
LEFNRGKILKTVGWTAIGIGFYLVGLGVVYDGEAVHINPKQNDDNIIDVDFTIIEE